MNAPTPDNGADRQAAPEDLPPLPDGGLGEAMPDWLRRPPAWRKLPRAQERPAERELPPPDTSIIDPRTFVDIADLPPWLQAIAARGGEEPAREDKREEEAAPVPAAAPQPSPAPKRVEFVPEEPATSAETDDASRTFVSLPPTSPAVPWWRSGVAIGTLLGLLLATVVLIVLLLTGTI